MARLISFTIQKVCPCSSQACAFGACEAAATSLKPRATEPKSPSAKPSQALEIRPFGRIRCYPALGSKYLLLLSRLSLATPISICAMYVAGLILLAALSLADGSRVYTPASSARRKHRLAEIETSLHAVFPLHGTCSFYRASWQSRRSSLRKRRCSSPKRESSSRCCWRYEWTAAHFAARKRNVAALKLLHEAGANLDAETNDGYTAACVAAETGKAESLEALAEAGADLNKACQYGRTPARYAAAFGYMDVLRFLIKAGVDLNKADEWGRTPADAAAGEHRPKVLKLILEAGANATNVEAFGYGDRAVRV
eukprot:s639_g9.t1